MTLDEAIKHLEETLNNPEHKWSCEECKAEHEQLLSWLKELKEFKEAQRGEWELESEETSFYTLETYKCSCCGWKVREKSKFCPDCGTRMNYQS